MAISIFVHGGAGSTSSDERGKACADGCLAAARIGYRILSAGGSALDAVEAACAALEDDPNFNAGTGSSLNADGEVEMDAALMDGSTLRAGAVAAIRSMRNPIHVARLVLRRSRHVLLAGAGAERFARDQGVPPWPTAKLVTERALDRWRREKDSGLEPRKGTVGAVALDVHGHLAAATSTGGTGMKLPGRIGDSPLVGCGTYADDRAAAVSCTGDGEGIIRVVLAKHVSDRVAAGASVEEAARSGIRELERIEAQGGLIVVDGSGRLAMACNAPRMSRASIDPEGRESAAYEV